MKLMSILTYQTTGMIPQHAFHSPINHLQEEDNEEDIDYLPAIGVEILFQSFSVWE